MRFIICIYLTFIFGCCFSQSNYNFLWYNTNDGLSQNSVHCIFRDNEGLVWIGTQDGLNSFDGKKFTSYKPLPNDTTSISDQFILKIIQDKQGYIWVGTRYGLNRLDKRTGKFSRFFLDEADKNKFQAVYSNIILDDNGDVLTPYSGKIFKYNYNKKIFEVVNKAFPIAYLFVTKKNKVYSFSQGKGFYSASTYSSNFTLLPLKIEGVFQKIVGSSSHIILLSALSDRSIIYVINPITNAIEHTLVINNIITDIFINQENTIYAAEKNGLFVIKNFREKIIMSPQNSNVPPGNLLSIFTDNENNIWLGSASAGFGLYSNKFANFTTIKTPIKNDVINAAIDDVKNIWIAANSGLYKYSKATSLLSRYITNKKITAIAKTNNHLYVGVEQEGLWQLSDNGSLIKKYHTENSLLKSNQILHLNTDKEGNILISSEINFYRIKKNEWQEIATPLNNKLVKGFYILHSFEDSKKNIWLSTNSGAYAFDSLLHLKTTLLSLTDTSPIKRTLITCITEDKSGSIWVASINKGIYKYSNNKLTQYNTTNGLTSDVVYNVKCDNLNRIWATTSNGLHIFNPLNNSFTQLSTFDGIDATSFTIGGMSQSLKKEFYLGSSNGLLVFNPANTTIEDKFLQAKIVDVKINGISIDAISNSLSIRPYNKTITFELGITQAFQPGTILYEYRLDSLDNWIQLPIGVTKITYNNLEYKKFNFQVRAAQSINSLKVAPVFNYTLHSIAPFWKTTLFKIFSAILALGLIIYFVQLYNKQKYKKQIQVLKTQKELQNERERIGRDLHDNIGAYTSALIAGLNQIESNDKNQLDNLKDYAGNIMGYLRETIWVLHNEQLNITAFADRFKNYAIKISKNYPAIQLHFNEQVDIDKNLSPQIMLNLFRILQEALQNAYKHSQASEIYIHIKCNQKIQFIIKDNGIGFSHKSKTDNYGLKNMQQRATEIGFIFTIENSNGTAVTIAENTANAV